MNLLQAIVLKAEESKTQEFVPTFPLLRDLLSPLTYYYYCAWIASYHLPDKALCSRVRPYRKLQF